ncbi:MAG TPA: AgmX/PglI C-terminal domain-containing protein [Kofleriaceae bacterium]|nr:AgmX/PglI C-terminal domain-containing protein [Kofleriaceae bacterium]
MAASRAARPAAGKSAGPVPRILRIGLILGGKIIEERLVRSRETITVGQSSKNTFTVPVDKLPKSWPLFSAEDGGYVLRFTDAMDGRISSGGSVDTLAALKDKHATRRSDHWAVKLPETARGKLILGEMTLLFQFVTAPPLQPRPRLPVAVRGTLADRIDDRLLVILAISIGLHFSVAGWAHCHDRVLMSNAERIRAQLDMPYQEDFDPTTFDLPKPADESEAAATEPAETPKDTEPKTPDKKPDKKPGADKPDEEPGGGSADAAIDEALSSSPWLDPVTGGASEGGRYAEIGNTDQGADLNKAIENIRESGQDVKSGGGHGKTRGHRGEIGENKGPGVDGPGQGGGVGDKKEQEIGSRATFNRPESFDESSLDPNSVAKIIRSRYLRGIQRCHQRVLKKDPHAGGRVDIEFTVGASGRVVSSKVNGFNSEVDTCIKGLTGSWRFPAPKGAGGQPGSATFFIPFVLKPTG